jgi:tRNA-specific 2-thiouridylase
VVGTREKLEKNTFTLKQINLFENLSEFECEVKVRYRTQAVPCYVKVVGEKASVILAEPVFGLAQGQAAAFYDGDRLLGGGVIC